MDARQIRAVLVGFGSANQAVLELALTRPRLDVVGIVVRSPAREGEPPARRVAGAPSALCCSTDRDGRLRDAPPDLAILATATPLADLLPVLSAIAPPRTPIA